MNKTVFTTREIVQLVLVASTVSDLSIFKDDAIKAVVYKAKGAVISDDSGAWCPGIKIVSE